jgi:TolB-like protein/class 3 adenylate cyclase/Tfp pilus assembly protein PilF
MTANRHLAAILTADVAGYSRLMGADEEGTHERVRAHLGQLVNPKVREHKGRTVKNTGDGLLVEFASVVDAVRCAVEIQRGMIDREPEEPDERRIRFRIGVNLGDVIAEGGDIFGDGVNVAARLEALAEPGGICISRVVRDQIRDKLAYALEDLGEQSVKNIGRPLRVYALRPEAVAALPAPSVPSAPPISQPVAVPHLSIVVLPFTNLSNDPEQQYFADGITEDVTTDLSRVADMFVISRNTAFTYQGKRVDTKQVGRELGVLYVLEGSVRRSGNQVRVNAQLIDAATDRHLWAERFDGDAADLFTLQNEITSRIAVALNLEVLSAEAARPIERPDVQEYILRARAQWNNPPARENYLRVIGSLEQALALDPRSVDAQSWLAAVLAGRVLNGMSDLATADIQRAEALAGQALAASPRSPVAHLAKGQVLRAQNRYAEAIPEYETVLASNRNWLLAIASLGWSKFLTGSMEEAIPLHEQAIRLSPRDPLIAVWYQRIGWAHLLQSRTDEAIPWLEKGRNANPVHPHARAWLASAYGLKGDIERAAAELAEARRLIADDRFSSLARLKTVGYFGVPEVRALFETTYLRGLRLAGMPEE